MGGRLVRDVGCKVTISAMVKMYTNLITRSLRTIREQILNYSREIENLILGSSKTQMSFRRTN